MDLQPNKTDGIYLPITNTRISASEWNQLVGSCMAFITEAGLTPDASDNEQFLNAFKAIAAGLELVGANTNLSNLTPTGEARFTTKANTDLSNVLASKGILTETYANGTSWYRVYSDGWCEQGGRTENEYGSSGISISLLKTMSDTNYSLQVTQITGRRDGISSSVIPSGYIIDESTIYVCGRYPVAAEIAFLQWVVCGYLAN